MTIEKTTQKFIALISEMYHETVDDTEIRRINSIFKTEQHYLTKNAGRKKAVKSPVIIGYLVNDQRKYLVFDLIRFVFENQVFYEIGAIHFHTDNEPLAIMQFLKLKETH